RAAAARRGGYGDRQDERGAAEGRGLHRPGTLDHLGVDGTTIWLIGCTFMPAGYPYDTFFVKMLVTGVPQPQTQRPKCPSLFISWRPVEQLPTGWKSPVLRSIRVHSYSPTGFHPVSVPAQSRLTSWSWPIASFARTTTRFVSG